MRFFFLLTSWSLLFLSRFVFFFWRCVLSNLTRNRSVARRYFTASVWGMIVWLMLAAGQWPFRRLNVMCDDLGSLTLIFHFFSHFSMMCKCYWRLSEAILGSSWVANISVSSANMPNVVSLYVGKSHVLHREQDQECSLGVHRNGCGCGLKDCFTFYYDEQMHNYFTNYRTATCFDIIVSSSGSL
jgi:hypothetical protein